MVKYDHLRRISVAARVTNTDCYSMRLAWLEIYLVRSMYVSDEEYENENSEVQHYKNETNNDMFPVGKLHWVNKVST